MLQYSGFSRNKALIKNGQAAVPRNIYGTLGDAYLQKRVVESLLEWALPADAADFNLDVMDAETTTINDVLSRASNLPFLSDYRVVHVRSAERLDGMHRSSEDAKENSPTEKTKLSPTKRLSESLEKLPATTVLILSRTPETPEPGARASTARCINAAVDKVIEKNGLIIDCTIGLKDAATATAALNQQAAQRDIVWGPDAAAHLVERSGHDITHLINEMEKCALRAGPGEPITIAIIDEMTKRAPQETIFNLTDALGARQTAHALGLLRELVESGEAPELILVMLVRHFRQLLQARAVLDAGLSLDRDLQMRLPRALADQLPRDGRENLAVLLQSQPWLGRRLGQQARNFTTVQLETALQAALAADLAMKGIEGDGGAEGKKLPELLLELLIAQFN